MQCFLGSVGGNALPELFEPDELALQGSSPSCNGSCADGFGSARECVVAESRSKYRNGVNSICGNTREHEKLGTAVATESPLLHTYTPTPINITIIGL